MHDFAFLLREQGEVRAGHDRHVQGLFDLGTWHAVLRSAGLEVEELVRSLPPEYEASAYTDRMLPCRRRCG